jgi:hypothetical protein
MAESKKPETSEKAGAPAPKKPYSPPRLTHYGSLKTLTTAGSTGGPENIQNPQATKMRP